MTPIVQYIDSGSPEWTPASLADARMWLDASDSSTITLSGSSISLWEDKVGSNDATDAVNSSNVTITTARPTIATADQNGLDAIAFNGAQWFDHASAKGLLRNRSCAVMALVYKFGTLSSIQNVWSNRDRPDAGRLRFNYMRLTYCRFQARRLPTDYDLIVETTATPPLDTNWNMVLCVMDYAQNAAALRVNGAVFATGNFLKGNANTDDTDVDAGTPNKLIAIGAGSRHGQTPLSNGSRIGELFCGAKTSGSYATSDIEKVEGYLAHKWGLASLLPSGHTYKNAAP
jgi:hypothetical protein